MSILADIAYSCTLFPHFLYHRLVTGKYGPRVAEKLGYVPARTGSAPCLWLHAVSVGEALASRTLVRMFEKVWPAWEVRVSTTTATGREVAARDFGAERVFYYPLDLSWMVDRSLERVKPSLVVLMELEVWPNFLAKACARNVPVVVCNARITERSVRGFRRLGGVARRMLGRVRLWLAQSEAYADALRGLGVPPERVCVVGSLKYDTVPTVIDPQAREDYRALLGAGEGVPVVIGGSTHPSEEEALLAAVAALRRDAFPQIKLVLVPRHPERLDEVERLAAAHGAVERRSRIPAAGHAEAPIVLVDTLGELGRLYAAADAVFVGGSLIPHGGQNMMEPCGLARPAVIGPSYFNFAEPMAVLQACDGLRVIAGAGDLSGALRAILEDPAAAAAMGVRARAALIARQGATARTLERLGDVMREHGASWT